MSITIGGDSFDLTYVNVSSDFVEQPGAILKIDPWGMDSITRKFTGRLDKVETELNKLEAKRNYRDSFYTFMHAVDWSVSHDAPFATLEITFKGIRGGKPRDPKVSRGRRVQTVSLQFIDSSGDKDGTSATVKYYAPYARCTYSSKTEPTAAKYKNTVNLTGIEVISITGDDERQLNFMRGPSLNGSTNSTTVLTALANSYNAMVELTGIPESEPVGQWFAVTELNEAILVPRGLTLGKRIVRV